MDRPPRNGLPPELDKIRSLAGIRRKAHNMIEEATVSALAAGYSPDRIQEILTHVGYPPPNPDPEWLKGYEAAKAGEGVPEGSAAYQGFQDFMVRNE